ncbi:MAG TPA: glutamate mutase L, partial [Petrotogaceae bacterium]|nr:glutamate mutase L [Petrotogaceae bacterium]
MKADVLIAEIGSTTTVLTALTGINGKNPRIQAQGEHYTTVSEGDVTIGIQGAVKDLEKKINEKVDWEILLASSSAAGG